MKPTILLQQKIDAIGKEKTANAAEAANPENQNIKTPEMLIKEIRTILQDTYELNNKKSESL